MADGQFEAQGSQPQTHFVATQLDDIAARLRPRYHRIAVLAVTNVGLAAFGAKESRQCGLVKDTHRRLRIMGGLSPVMG